MAQLPTASVARAPGARVCVGILSLADITREFVGRKISVTRSREDLPEMLFPGALGRSFENLPAAVAALHVPERTSV